jgi:mevalonate kinase
MRLKKPVEVVIGDTGIIANTKAMLAGISERKQASPEQYARLLEDARQVAEEATVCIDRTDFEAMGRLMDTNQALLQEAQISCPELDLLIRAARDAGAWGAKLTGGGGGGCMLALSPGQELQARVAAAIQAKGFQAYRTTLGIS